MSAGILPLLLGAGAGQYMLDKYRGKRQAGRMSGLLGEMQKEQATTIGAGPLESGYVPLEQGQTDMPSKMELMQQVASDPAMQARMATGLMGIPGMEQQGGGMLQQMMRNTQATQMQEMKYQQGGGYQSLKDRQSVTRDLRNDYNKASLVPRTAGQNFDNATRLVNKGVQNMTGQDDIALIKMLAKAMLPNEAVMSDDVTLMQNASAKSEMVRAYWNALTTKEGAALSPEVRQQMYDTIKNLTEGQRTELSRIQSNYTGFAQDASIDPVQVLGGQTYQFGKAAAGAPDKKAYKVGETVKGRPQ